IDADCDDGKFFNGLETCDANGSCQAGTPVVCDDGVGCTDDICDEGSDSCVSSANDANCTDDGQFCTGNEYCDATAGCTSAGDPCAAGESCNESNNSCDLIPGGCSEGDFPVIVNTDYNEKAGKLNIEGFASEGSTITIENADNGQVLAEGINVRNGSWKSIINKLNTIPEHISVISSNGCSVDLFIGHHDDDHHDDD
ncbi:MAG: hypothetical protein JRD19_07870, partial [Deltaproteobacteria bacterium]|nr:hypothetical protein [Deltaproteobacteria bacterium]